MEALLLTLLVAVGLICSASAQDATSDTFGTGANQFSIDFRTIGNAGNAADTTGYGSVGYTYRIGTYDISQNQIDKATTSGMQNVVAGYWSGDQPAASMSWYESAAFVNWLNVTKGFQPAYNLTWSGSTWSMALWTVTDSGYDANNKYRNSLAKYFLPSENEFYKAAYGKSDGSGYYLYPTASDTASTPVASGTAAGTAVCGNQSASSSVYQAGGLSSYGTMGQGGNVWQWEETAEDGVNNSSKEAHGIRGGVYSLSSLYFSSSYRYPYNLPPDYEFFAIGFRVASVDIASIPEPSTYALFGIGAIGMLMVIRKKKTV